MQPETPLGQTTPRKLAFFRKAGQGDPAWSGRCVYGLDSPSPSVSEYDAHDVYGDLDDGLHTRVRAGVTTVQHLNPPAEPTTTRESRVAASFNSTPASRFFQGFAQVRWSGVFEGYGLAPRALVRPRPLVQNANPNQVGSKELHPTISYRPFPPMGSIIPQYGSGDKAL